MNTETIEEVKLDEKIERTVIDPGKYNVVFLNDDQTPMEFVIEVLIGIFKHSRETSEKITLDVHTNDVLRDCTTKVRGTVCACAIARFAHMRRTNKTKF